MWRCISHNISVCTESKSPSRVKEIGNKIMILSLLGVTRSLNDANNDAISLTQHFLLFSPVMHSFICSCYS